MKPEGIPSRLPVAGIGLVIFLADRYLKNLVVTHMVPGQSIWIWHPVLAITFVLNSGAAFGLLQHQSLLFIVVALALLIGVAVFLARRSTLPGMVVAGLGLLAGGAAGNLWDRLVAGRVVDYIHIGIWPVFNLADASIVVGMLAVMAHYWGKDAKQDLSRPKGSDVEGEGPVPSTEKRG